MAKTTRHYRFELPYRIAAPVLADAGTGIDRVLLRGRRDRRTGTVTLLDTTDERLNWAGILLAHQVVGDCGRWLLRAPEWQPWLPAEREEPLDGGDELPERLAVLLKPFRRRAPLGPVAEVGTERAGYALLDETGVELGLLLDDRVTVRRGGLAVGRFREVSFEPGAAMPAAARSAVVDRLHQVGAVRVDRFREPMDRLVELLHPVPAPAELADPGQVGLEEFLEWLFASRLFALLRAELQVRCGQVPDTGLLQTELGELAELLRGLTSQLDEVWANELAWHLDRLGALSVRTGVDELGEHYQDVLDALAAAARAPRLRAGGPAGETGGRRTAREVLAADTARLVGWLVGRLDGLVPERGDADWAEARDLAARLLRQLSASEPVAGKVRRRQRRMLHLLTRLDAADNPRREPSPEDLARLGAQRAYEEGRRYQAGLDEVLGLRRELLAGWPQVRAALLADWPGASPTGSRAVPSREAGPVPTGDGER